MRLLIVPDVRRKGRYRLLDLDKEFFNVLTQRHEPRLVIEGPLRKLLFTKARLEKRGAGP